MGLTWIVCRSVIMVISLGWCMIMTRQVKVNLPHLSRGGLIAQGGIGESGVSWVTFFQMALTFLIFKIESRVRHLQKLQDVKFNFIGEIYFCVVQPNNERGSCKSPKWPNTPHPWGSLGHPLGHIGSPWGALGHPLGVSWVNPWPSLQETLEYPVSGWNMYWMS